MEKHDAVYYLETSLVVLIGLLLVGLPLVFTTITTDGFGIPKQTLLSFVGGLGILLWCGQMMFERAVRVKKTPFDIPVLLFVIVALVSAVLSANRYESIIAASSVFFAAAVYFIIVQAIRSKAMLFTMSMILVGVGVVITLNAALSYFKIYLLPFEFAKAQTFSPIGSYFDQALVLSLILPIALYFAMPLLKLKSIQDIRPLTIVTSLASLLITVGLGLTIYGLATQFNPRILPFETGFQTAFASISQDSGRTLQGFLLGSGYGTYNIDFSRFKQAAFNLNTELWNLQFIRSSSFVLELLATTGVLGVGAFVLSLIAFIKTSTAEKKTNPFYISLFIAFVLAFVLPFSFITVALFFIILGLFVASQNYPDAKLQFSAFTEGLMTSSPFFGQPSHTHAVKPTIILPALLLAVFVVVLGFFSYWGYRFLTSDLTFQRSLISLSQNNATNAYDLQNKAIVAFPYRDFYHRSFSQLNLALANSLAQNQPKNSSPSAQTQQTLVSLIQQSINSARSAAAVSPQTSMNWQNLSSIYRSLIGFGQNAESFSVLAQQQAIILDPNNPQLYINLGGLYYQLKEWDLAARQFQVAINLKPDFANAYYNLGHALENKGDLQRALAQYNAVKNLVGDNKESLDKINKEIEALQDKIGSAKPAETPVTGQRPVQNQPELEVNRPTNPLPEQEKKVDLPPPPAASESARP